MDDEEITLVDEEVEITEDVPAADAGKTTETEDKDKAKLINEIKNLEMASEQELRDIKKIRLQALQDTRQVRKSERQKLIEKLDTEDESVQVWNARIEEEVAPVNQILEQNKQEIFDEALMEFAQEHPMSKMMVERVMNTYSALATSSGLNLKAVMRDISRAYAAESVEEQSALETKASHAEKLATRASAGVTKADGSSGGSGPAKLSIPKAEYEILKQAGLSDDKIKAHYKDKQKQ